MLDEYAAVAAGRVEAVGELVAFDVVLLPDLTTLDELDARRLLVFAFSNKWKEEMEWWLTSRRDHSSIGRRRRRDNRC